MKDYKTDQLRNVVLLSHQGTGKTTLTESMFLASGAINRAALANGTLLMCGLCGTWAVLRARLPRAERLPQRAWLRALQQALWELAMGVAVSLIMVAGLGLPARWLGWDVVWTETSLGSGVASLLRATVEPPRPASSVSSRSAQANKAGSIGCQT